MKNIVVAIDKDGTNNAAIRMARSLAKAFGAKVWLVHVAAPDPAFVGFDAGPQSARDERARQLREEHRALQDMAEALRHESLTAESRILEGETVATLLRHGQAVAADMIILQRSNRSSLARKFIGATCESVVRHSECPVLVLPSE